MPAGKTSDLDTVATVDVRVSERGQMSLPAAARHRWGLADGGTVGCLDLGSGMLLIPKNLTNFRRELLQSVAETDWNEARDGFGDPELATE